MGKYVYVRDVKKKAGDPGTWSEKKKAEVVTTYVAVGSLANAAAICKVPLVTVKYWKKQPWFEQMMMDIRSGETEVLDAKLSKIVDKSLDVVMDRLKDGDFILDSKTGTIKRVPVKLRDAKSAMTELFDKRQLIRKQPTKITEQQTIEVRLENLANSFARFIKQERDIPNTIEAEHYEVLQQETES